MEDRYAVVDKVMGKLTLEQKVGQLFTQAFYGSLLVPDVIRTIKELNCGGLRITQYFRGFRRYARAGETGEAFDKLSPRDMKANLLDDRKDLLCTSPYLNVPQYAELLKRIKDVAAERPYDIPLHMMLDQEGGSSFDCCRGGIRYFPLPFGYARLGNAKLVYDVAKATALQLSALGFNMINSPVVDIVFDPSATYIGTRAFGTDVDMVCKMSVAAMKGYHDGGMIACAKHFPGRGATAVDAHHDVGSIDKTDEALWNEDLAPYRAMMPEGLKAIMVGHSIYPAWDPDDIASVSKKVITGLIQERMGFTGMICTDSMIMGAIQKKYGVAGGCLAAIKAGASEVLMKECGPIREESYRLVLEAVKSGELTEAYIDQLVIRNIKAKVDAGLYGASYKHDPKKAEKVVRSAAPGRIEIKAAEEAVHVVRDTAKMLPLPSTTRALLVEQVSAAHLRTNDLWCHPGIFWEQICQHTENVSLLEICSDPTDEDRKKFTDYMADYDTLIMTFYRDRHTLGAGDLINQALAAGKKVVVVAQSPLPYVLPAEWPTVVCSYGVMAPSLKAAADLIYGKLKAKRSKHRKSWEARPMTDILIPKSGDFDAWKKSSDACIAIDWDGTCKDTMLPKWTRGFNLAISEVWPQLKPFQKEVDDVCYKVNMVEPTAGVQRFVALKFMMARWKAMGLPVPDLSKFFAAVEAVEARGDQHGVTTYQKLQKEFGYDDSPLRWSDASDRHIAVAVRSAKVFDHCEDVLRAIYRRADLIVVSASKTEAVRQDMVADKMAELFKALCAQDFLPKRGILEGLKKRYARVLFIGDTQYDLGAAKEAGVPIFLVTVGDEAASWAKAGPVIEKFLAGANNLPELIYA